MTKEQWNHRASAPGRKEQEGVTLKDVEDIIYSNTSRRIDHTKLDCSVEELAKAVLERINK